MVKATSGKSHDANNSRPEDVALHDRVVPKVHDAIGIQVGERVSGVDRGMIR